MADSSQARFTRETVESGSLFLKSHQPFRERHPIQRRVPFLLDIVFVKYRNAPVSFKSVLGYRFPKMAPIFGTSIHGQKSLLDFFSERGYTVKYSNDASGETKNGSGYVSLNDRKYSEKR